MEDAFSGSAGLPASIFDLGIGPIINASWVLSGFMLFKPLGLATQIKELRRNGREVRSKPQRICVALVANTWHMVCLWVGLPGTDLPFYTPC